MKAIVSVTDRRGNTWFHTRAGLVPFDEKHKATHFKTLDHAIKFARKNYKETELKNKVCGWSAIIIKEEVNQCSQ